METEEPPGSSPPPLAPRVARSVGPFGLSCAFAGTVTVVCLSGVPVAMAMLVWLPVVAVVSGLVSAAAGWFDGRRARRVEVFAGRRVCRSRALGVDWMIGWRVLRGTTIDWEQPSGSLRPAWRASVAEHAGLATAQLLLVLGIVGAVTATGTLFALSLGLAWICGLIAVGVVRTLDRVVVPRTTGAPAGLPFVSLDQTDEVVALYGASWAAFDAGHTDLAWTMAMRVSASSGSCDTRVRQQLHNHVATIGLVDGRDEWFEEAAVHAATAVEVDPCAATYDTWAWVLLRRGRAADAHTWFAAAYRGARADGNDWGAVVSATGLAGAAAALGDPGLARAWRDIARRLDPAARLDAPAWHRHPPAPDPTWRRTALDRWASRAPARRVERWVVAVGVGSLPFVALEAVALVRPPLAVLSWAGSWAVMLGCVAWGVHGRIRRL